MQPGKARDIRYRNKSSGFTLFEMVVVICCIVILYRVAEQRMNDLPAAAERANFFSVLQQIKTGVNFAMISKVTSGSIHELQALDGTNPMEFLLEPPSNYRGELDVVTDENVTRRSWYFETSSGQLVYVVGGTSIDNVAVTISPIPVKLGQIRLKLENEYSEDENRNSSYSAASWQGLLLNPVYPFIWEQQTTQIDEIVNPVF